MIDELLYQLVEHSFRSADELSVVIDQCRQAAIETGDARYLIIGEALDAIVSEFADYGAITTRTLERIWAELRVQLPVICDAGDPAAGSRAAKHLLTEIRSLLARNGFPS